MQYRDTAIKIALDETGYRETKTNIVKYWDDVAPAYQGQPWCMGFLAWCIERDNPDNQLVAVMRDAKYNCGELYKWITTVNKYPIIAGMVAVYDSDGNGRSEHCGLIVSGLRPNGTYQTVEGNNGNSVMLTSRAAEEILAVYPATDYVYAVLANQHIDTLEYWTSAQSIPKYLDTLLMRMI